MPNIESKKKRTYRPDVDGNHQAQYQKNRARLIASRGGCALCGMPIDYSLKFPNPMSFTADHIIPVAKGGHPSDINNLQPAHLICNQVKSSKLVNETNAGIDKQNESVSNRILPKTIDWLSYKS